MKNTAALLLSSEPAGSVTGHLTIFFKCAMSSLNPAEINAALHKYAIKELLFLGVKSGVRCSFPLTVGNLHAVLSLVEDDAQVRFITRLDGDYTVTIK